MDKKQILIVDDESDITNFMKEALGDEGISCLSAMNGIDALRLLSSHNDIAGVFCDLTMPGLDGYGVLREMLLNFPHVPVVVISAHFESDRIIDVLRLGAIDYLVKPAALPELVSKAHILFQIHKHRSKAYAQEDNIDRELSIRNEAICRIKNAA